MIGSDMIDTLYASDDLGDTFSRITGTAVQVLDACDFASVTTVNGGELTTEAPTDQAALTADRRPSSRAGSITIASGQLTARSSNHSRNFTIATHPPRCSARRNP